MLAKLQEIIWEMGVRFFGKDDMENTRVRGYRMFEEAAEVVHSMNLEKAKLHQIVDMVYDRDVGDLYCEVGDLFITLSALCSNRKFDVDQLIEFNVRRCLRKDPETMRRRAVEKIDAGLS